MCFVVDFLWSLEVIDDIDAKFHHEPAIRDYRDNSLAIHADAI